MNPRIESLLKYAMILLGLLFSAAFFVTLKIHFDNVQILDKALLLIREGVWTHHGNAGSGVGFVPGTFLTFITAIPMKIYFSPYSAMFVIALFHLASVFLLKNVLDQVPRPLLFLDFLLIYWLNPWRVEQAELYNPAYLFLFSALHLWTVFHMREKKFWFTLVNVLAVGFCAQVHFSALILGILSLMLLYVGFIRVHWRGLLAGIVIVLLSLVPYFLELMNKPEVNIEVARSSEAFLGRNLLLVYPVLKAVAYWFRYGSSYFGRHIFSEINFEWLRVDYLQMLLSYSFHILKWVIALGSLYFSFKVNFKNLKMVWLLKPFKKGEDRTQQSPEDRIRSYGFYLFVSMLLTSALSPVEFNHWHLILCFPLVATWMSLYLNDLRRSLSNKRFQQLFTFIFCCFFLFNMFGYLGSRSHSYLNNFHRDVMKYYESR